MYIEYAKFMQISIVPEFNYTKYFIDDIMRPRFNLFTIWNNYTVFSSPSASPELKYSICKIHAKSYRNAIIRSIPSTMYIYHHSSKIQFIDDSQRLHDFLRSYEPLVCPR